MASAGPGVQNGPDITPVHEDPIRIVPLSVSDEMLRPVEGAAPAVAPQLTYRGGPLLTNVQVFTVFWGNAWANPPISDTASRLNDFFDFILQSALIDQLAEYNVGGRTIGHGKRIGTAVVTSPATRRTTSDTAVQHMLQHQIATNNTFPQPSAETLYFVYLPPGVAVVQGGDRSCQAFCGYHNDINGQIFYAVMPYPGCNGCRGTLSEFDALTATSSHELCEAITDPIPGQGWYDDNNGEIGDICAWKIKQVGSYQVQQEWSNSSNKCQ
jgi:hypothetical protein